MDTYAILDMRGLVQRSLHSGTDRDAIKDSITGRPINTPGHALDKLLVDYLLPILDELRAKQIIAVWDGGNLYRRILYPKYKENRRQREESPEMKAALAEAIRNAKLLLLYLGAQQVIVDDVEGDDVIAWLVNALPSTLVYTVDGDLIQLNSDKCSVFVGREFRDTLKDDDVEVPARWVCLYKSLVGDTSDNYPGVPGFGKKSWVALAEEHGDEGLQMLQDWVASARFNDFLTLVRNNPGVDKRLEKIANHTKEWLESWRLARLHPDQVGWKVNKPVRDRVSGEVISKGESGFQTPKWSTGLPRADKLIALLTSVGCRHLIERLAPHMPNRPAVLGRKLLGDNLDDAVRELQEAFAESPFIALDWETSAPVNENFIKASNGREYVDMLGSSLTGAGFTFGKRLEHTFYIPIDHADSDNVPVDFIKRLVDVVPEGVPLVIQNAYFENVIFKNHFGYHLPEFHDTKVMASHQDEQSSNGLKDLSLRILGYKQLRYSDVIEPGKAMKDYSADYILQYGADDPLVTAHIYEFLKLQLMLEGTWDFVRENEFCPIYHLSNAYLDGLNVDWEELARQHEEDISIRDTSIERLRVLLKTYQTPELIEQGVQNLLAVEMEVINALRDENVRTGAMTAEEADEDRNKAITAAMGSLYNRIEYKDITKVEKPYKFALTPIQFNKVAGALGLPTLDKATKAGWQAWLERAMIVTLPRDGLRIVELVADCIGTIASASKVSCPVRANLVAKCRQIMWDKVLTEEQKYEYVGSELSLSSPPQQLALLYGMLALPIRIRSFEPSGVREKLGLEGGPQANEDAILTAMALDAEEGTWKREALECLMAAKKADTRCKIFYVAYPLWKHPKTGLVHPQLNSCGTESRRMSGSSPNLMQAPKRGDGVKFRRCMLPAREHNLVGSIDWAGEELRVGAGLSLDIEMLSCYIDSGVLSILPDWMLEKLGPAYLKRFRSSVLRDIHSLTASGMAKLAYEEFERIRHDEHHPDKDRLKKIRNEAKSVNFLSQYGGGPAKLARKLISKVEVAEEYLAAKKALYHGYESWRADMISDLNRRGYLSTLYGTRRHLYNKLLTTDNGLKGYLERSALNFLIQGVCADYLKSVLTVLWKQQTFQRHGAKFLAPIHDEIVFTFDSSVASSLILEVHSVMVRGIPGLPCPLWAEPSVGPNFGVQYEIGPHPTPELIKAAVEKALTHNSQ